MILESGFNKGFKFQIFESNNFNVQKLSICAGEEGFSLFFSVLYLCNFIFPCMFWGSLLVLFLVLVPRSGMIAQEELSHADASS